MTHYIKQDPANGNKFELTLGDSFEGTPHLQIEIEFPDAPNKAGTVKILTQDLKEIEFIRKNLKTSDGLPIFSSNETEAKIPFNSTLLFCDLAISKITHTEAERLRDFNPQQLPALMLYGAYRAQRIYLPSMDTDQNSPSAVFYKALTQHTVDTAPIPRIDGHTHFVASFPMNDALQKAMASKPGDSSEHGKIHIPLILLMTILKSKGILSVTECDRLMNILDKKEMPLLPKDGIRTSPAINEWGNQADFSGIYFQMFKNDLDQMPDAEKHKYFQYREGAIEEAKAFYCDLHQVQSLLGDKWVDFCNGFDMDSTHSNDYTEHMKTSYNYRGWFGKDIAYLRAQLESLFEHNAKQNIGYVELPGDFSRSNILDKFTSMVKDIEERRVSEGQVPIIVRPSLSISRSLDPIAFRKQLFEAIPFIVQNPSLASIAVLSHEVNPTTAHLSAIKAFLDVMNTVRPGFTVEVHAGETEYYGEVNTNEARKLALQAKRIVIRAGHSSYGKHDELSPDNYIEEKCPLSNACLIDLDAKVHVDVFMGIAEGKTHMFWGSDGVIYNPEYGPKQQEAFLKQIMASPLCVEELKRRWSKVSQYEVKGEIEVSFNDYLRVLAKNFNEQLKVNQEREQKYISFKQNERILHALRLIVAYTNTTTVVLTEQEKVILGTAKNLLVNLYDMDTHEQFSNWLADKATAESLKTCCAALEQNVELSDVTTNRDKLEKVTQKLLYDTPRGLKHGLLILNMQERKKLEVLSSLHKLMRFYHDEIVVGHLTETQKDSLTVLENLYKEIPREDKDQILQFFSRFEENNAYKINKKTFEEDLKKITTPALRKDYEKYKFSGHEDSELIIDPQWLHIKQQEHVKQENKTIVQKGAISAASNLLHPDQEPLVLFGEPERGSNESQQKVYMGKMYQTIYDILNQGPERQIVLFGGIEDGINPLVYKVVREHPELVQARNIVQIIAADEDFSAISKSRNSELFGSETGPVPYRIVPGSKREESHITYADFILKHKISEMRMFGDGPIWSDLKTVLDSRNLLDKIKFYPDGFSFTKTSYAYADKLSANQKITIPAVINKAIVTPAIEEALQSDLYSAKQYKTMPLFNNVLHSWYALGESQIEEQVSFKEYCSLFYPVAGEHKEQNAIKIAAFFKKYIPECNTIQLNLLESAFTSYGLMSQANVGLRPFNLGSAINSAKSTTTTNRSRFHSTVPPETLNQPPTKREHDGVPTSLGSEKKLNY